VDSEKIGEMERKLLEIKRENINRETVKSVLDEFHQKSMKPHQFVLSPYLEEMNQTFSGRSVEEILEKLESKGSEWSRKQLETLKKMSPTSMKVTFRQLAEGANMEFKDVFRMEFRLSHKCVEAKKDFYEGVRAVLIDKDNSPKWDPPNLEGVSEKLVDWYFAPLQPNQEWTVSHL